MRPRSIAHAAPVGPVPVGRKVSSLAQEEPRDCGILGKETARAESNTAKREGDVVVRGRAGPLVQDIPIGAHLFLADDPLAVGGTDAAPPPSGFLLASLGASPSMTLELSSRRK